MKRYYWDKKQTTLFETTNKKVCLHNKQTALSRHQMSGTIEKEEKQHSWDNKQTVLLTTKQWHCQTTKHGTLETTRKWLCHQETNSTLKITFQRHSPDNKWMALSRHQTNTLLGQQTNITLKTTNKHHSQDKNQTLLWRVGHSLKKPRRYNGECYA